MKLLHTTLFPQKKLRRRIAEYVRDQYSFKMTDFVVATHIRKPYTCVTLKIENFLNSGEDMEGVGFSKVCVPDAFDYQEGIRLATGRALSDLASQIAANYAAAEAFCQMEIKSINIKMSAMPQIRDGYTVTSEFTMLFGGLR